MDTLRQQVQEGNVEAMSLLAHNLLTGEGVAQDGAEAVRLLERAVAAGSAEAARSLGRAYFRGRGVQYDRQKSLEWFRRETAMRASGPQSREIKLPPRNRVAVPPDTQADSANNDGTDLACQWMVPPQMPRAAVTSGQGGTVRATALVVDGEVKDVLITAGPKVFYAVVRQAMLQYGCTGSGVKPQEFSFRIAEPGQGYIYWIESLTRHSKVPAAAVNADWAGLSDAQRRVVRAAYPQLPATHEPPYPVKGLGNFWEDVRGIAVAAAFFGRLRLEVTVDAQGEATAVHLQEGLDPTLGQQVTAMARQLRFKPAACDGAACSMVFPMDMQIARDTLTPHARKMVEAAAQDGDARSQNILGQRHESGLRVEKNLAHAARWYGKAAAQDFSEAQYNLARLLEAGDGVDKDLAQALSLYRAAAEKGYAPAQNSLGVMLARGSGTGVDLVEAAKWFERAQQQGHGEAQLHMARAYETGQGVAQNADKAKELYQLAQDNGQNPSRLP